LATACRFGHTPSRALRFCVDSAVTAKCTGGGATRKRETLFGDTRLLDKQKTGKKKMRRFGKVNIPRGKRSSRRLKSTSDVKRQTMAGGCVDGLNRRP
jgi:hypothetical protein